MPQTRCPRHGMACSRSRSGRGSRRARGLRELGPQDVAALGCGRPRQTRSTIARAPRARRHRDATRRRPHHRSRAAASYAIDVHGSPRPPRAQTRSRRARSARDTRRGTPERPSAFVVRHRVWPIVTVVRKFDVRWQERTIPTLIRALDASAVDLRDADGLAFRSRPSPGVDSQQ